MNIISEIDFHEMKRRWTKGEVNSRFFYSEDPALRKETLTLLQSGDRIKEEKGIERHFGHLGRRRNYISTIPSDTKWFLVSLPIIESEFRKFKTIKENNGWGEYSSRTYRFCDAANHLIKKPGKDTRVKSIIDKFIDRKVEMMGITFISKTNKGPYIIAEGTARLVAIYYHCILKGIKIFENNTIEVVLGVSKTKWCYSPD